MLLEEVEGENNLTSSTGVLSFGSSSECEMSEDPVSELGVSGSSKLGSVDSNLFSDTGLARGLAFIRYLLRSHQRNLLYVFPHHVFHVLKCKNHICRLHADLSKALDFTHLH